MKTLVIHPNDVTTAFLSDIYEDRDWTVIDKEISGIAFRTAIREHDRIIMLGHGDDYGLYGHSTYLIDSKLVYLLREKECVAIWCNADVFFKKYGLTGFYTGMIISEVDEAHLCCLHDFTYEQVLASNTLFSHSIKQSIGENGFLNKAKELYIGDDNPIIAYNMQRMYITENSSFI